MINTQTRSLERIPPVMRVKLEKLAPKPKRNSVPLDQARRKIPDLKPPFQVNTPIRGFLLRISTNMLGV
jgi:hypothetical protein